LGTFISLGKKSKVQKGNDAVKLEEGFAWLFNSKDLTGWEGNPEWFRIEEDRS